MRVASHEELNKFTQLRGCFIYGNHLCVTDIDTFEGDNNRGKECVLKFYCEVLLFPIQCPEVYITYLWRYRR